MALTTLLLASKIAYANPSTNQEETSNFYVPMGASVTFHDDTIDTGFAIEGHSQLPKVPALFYSVAAAESWGYQGEDPEFVFQASVGLDSLDTNRRVDTGISAEAGIELRDNKAAPYGLVLIRYNKEKTLQLAAGPSITYRNKDTNIAITGRLNLIFNAKKEDNE